MRTWLAVLVSFSLVGAFSATSAQVCGNVAPNAPTDLTAVRLSDTQVLIQWSIPASACAATKFYTEVSRSHDQVIEASTGINSIVMNVPKMDAVWRIAVRAFNAFGLSSQVSVALNEASPTPVVPNVPAPNPCTMGAVYPPQIVSANAVGRVLSVQWTGPSICQGGVTGFTILGQYDPNGPVVGTIDIPYPNVRSWSGVVPPGTYYVSVVTRFYQLSSVASNAILVHVQ
jgi:hypothetical protein